MCAHTHTHTHSLSLSLSHTHTHTHTHIHTHTEWPVRAAAASALGSIALDVEGKRQAFEAGAAESLIGFFYCFFLKKIRGFPSRKGKPRKSGAARSLIGVLATPSVVIDRAFFFLKKTLCKLPESLIGVLAIVSVVI